ncbi:MAG: methyltransferase domain-containing protein [Planctomycetota bacterium]|nr:methyltransferase domain-containing protein [Planctomycetota bacterium]
MKRLRHLRWLGRRVVRSDPAAVPFKRDSFDAIVCSQVLEHLPDTSHLLDSLTSTLREGGIILVGVHGWDSWVWRLEERLYRFLMGAEEDRHYRQTTPGEVAEDLEKLGLSIVSRKRVGAWETIITARRGPVDPPSDPS